MIGMRSSAAAPSAFARGARRVAGSAAAPSSLAASPLLLRRRRPSLAARAGGVAPELKQEIEALLAEHRVVLFMKGTKAFPMCGFSGTCVQILRTLNVGGAELPFHTVNILEREDLRSGMKEYSQWPTFPQVYIDGEFFGGCDIMLGEFLGGGLLISSRGARGSAVFPFARRPVLRSRSLLVPFTNNTNNQTDAYQSGELQETVERVMAA
jgi:monothiol glutaredoxin